MRGFEQRDVSPCTYTSPKRHLICPKCWFTLYLVTLSTISTVFSFKIAYSPPLDAHVLQDGPDADEHAEAHDEPPKPLAVRVVDRQVVLDPDAAAVMVVGHLVGPVMSKLTAGMSWLTQLIYYRYILLNTLKSTVCGSNSLQRFCYRLSIIPRCFLRQHRSCSRT